MHLKGQRTIIQFLAKQRSFCIKLLVKVIFVTIDNAILKF